MVQRPNENLSARVGVGMALLCERPRELLLRETYSRTDAASTPLLGRVAEMRIPEGGRVRKPRMPRSGEFAAPPYSDGMNDPVGSRQANLSRLLRLAHLEGPVSRATLTAATGLNRSTIGDLVGDLASLGVVEERAPDPSRRVGRPSPLVAAHHRV